MVARDILPPYEERELADRNAPWGFYEGLRRGSVDQNGRVLPKSG